PERRGAAFGIWGAVAGLATIAGPTLGGLLVTAFDWRWIFFVNLPIGAAVLAVTPLIIALGVVLLAAFLLVEKARQDREPLVPFSLFRSRNFTIANWISGTLSI